MATLRTLSAILAVLGSMVTYPAPAALAAPGRPGNGLPNPVLFVTQMPIPEDFATIGSVLGNHEAGLVPVGRGGDLYILHPDGSLVNLTRAAGYGQDGFQGDTSIAVRDPAVHWSGSKAVFSMVVGGAGSRYEVEEYYWQLYEITGLGKGDTPSIVKVANQPTNYNNVEPTYASDDRILFASDRPRNGARHLYPQLDEYEAVASTTGLWSLDPTAGDIFLMNHSPSGAFSPTVDSFGRVVFVRWDHLQRDQLLDDEVLEDADYGAFDWANEAQNASILPASEGIYPEPRPTRTDLLPAYMDGIEFNQFFPWQLAQDGSAEETLNHIGRHELYEYFNRSRTDDPALVEFIASRSGRVNENSHEVFLQVAEDPTLAGYYLGTSAPEFGTHASGQLVAILAPPTANPDLVSVDHLTHPDTRTIVSEGQSAPPNHSGHYRDPLPLSDGSILASHASEVRRARNEGSRKNPQPRYDFRLVRLERSANGYWVAGAPLTDGIDPTLSYWDPDVLVSYDGPLWELNPVEVRTRAVPPSTESSLNSVDSELIEDEGIDLVGFREWLRQRDLAVLAVRNVTSRDLADRQQPFNLRVPGGTQTTSGSGKLYDVTYLQLFQADQLRGYTNHRVGRRTLPRVLHDAQAIESNPSLPQAPAGSLKVSSDGSVAGFVPARRALSWHLVNGGGSSIVKERYWLSFQSGEVRVCDGCHGVNTSNQAGQPAASQPPEALRTLLRRWRDIFSDDFETGDTLRW